MNEKTPENIEDGEIVVLFFKLNSDEDECESLLKNLPDHEQHRANEFQCLNDRVGYIKCRNVLRKTLATWLECEPKELNITCSEHGKPYLEHSQNIEFNITHTKGLAAIAFSKTFTIGIDTENTEREVNLVHLSEKVFNEKERFLISSETPQNQKKMFFRLWTAKEAFLKNTGLGLRLDPKKINVTHSINKGNNGRVECDKVNSGPSLLIELKCQEPYVTTLCTSEKGTKNIKTIFL